MIDMDSCKTCRYFDSKDWNSETKNWCRYNDLPVVYAVCGYYEPMIKPCPFCGSKDVGLHHFGDGFLDTVMVECNDCGVSVHSKDYELDEKDAIELWNRRVKE